MPADAFGAFVDGDAVTARQQPGAGQSGDAGADDGDIQRGEVRGGVSACLALRGESRSRRQTGPLGCIARAKVPRAILLRVPFADRSCLWSGKRPVCHRFRAMCLFELLIRDRPLVGSPEGSRDSRDKPRLCVGDAGAAVPLRDAPRGVASDAASRSAPCSGRRVRRAGATSCDTSERATSGHGIRHALSHGRARQARSGRAAPRDGFSGRPRRREYPGRTPLCDDPGRAPTRDDPNAVAMRKHLPWTWTHRSRRASAPRPDSEEAAP